MIKRYICSSCGDIITEWVRQGNDYRLCKYGDMAIIDEDGEMVDNPINESGYCTPGEILTSMLLDAHRDPTARINPREDGNYIIQLAEQIKEERRYVR